MYRKILVALDHTPADESLIPHVAELARMCGAELLLLHVADGWTARNYHQLNLAESEEMREDTAYLEELAGRLKETGLSVRTLLALGEPPSEILTASVAEGCDLIAMTTHGHRLIGDLLLGSTIDHVRHRSEVPILVVRAKRR
jgi:nucleotide-binding universal stress UspA family protein